ncbi:MAG TPA: hypothetical protein VKY26_11005 [Actinomycetota bacterium]|nr:hypothetical protein [Actinomycetota bacterium]
METLIGFAIGYWAGTRDGSEGLTRAIAAFDSIIKSDGLKGFMSQGLSMGGTLLSKGIGDSGGSAIAANVIGMVADRAGKILGGGLRAA